MTSAMSDCSTMTSTRAGPPKPLVSTPLTSVLRAGHAVSYGIRHGAALAALVVAAQIVAGSGPATGNELIWPGHLTGPVACGRDGRG